MRLGSGANGTTGGTIGINQTATVQFRATVDRAAAGTTLSNTASLSYLAHTINKQFSFIGNQVDTAVGTLADLAITKTSAPASQTAGSPVIYTMTGTNHGPNSAATVVMTDTLPAGISYVSSAPPAGTSCSAAGRVVTCTTATVPNGGSVAVPITTSIEPGTAAGTFTDQAAISSATADDVPTNNSAIATTAVTASADVSITKAVSPNPVRAGTPVTYVLTATNAGPSNATSVTVTDPVPAGQTVTSATTTVGTCTISGSLVTCPVGTLGPTGKATITITATVAANAPAGTVNNTATASAVTPDPDSTNKSATAALTINTSADLVITKTAATNPVVAGTAQTYTIKVANNGPSDAANVKVSDPAVAGLTLLSAAPTQGSCTVTAGRVDCLLGTVAASGTVTITVQGTVGSTTAPGTLTNTASVTSDTLDPDATTNTVSTPVTVTASADVGLSKSANPVGTIVPGNQVTYTLTATNTGPSQASGVSISDPLPTGLTFVSSADGCTAAAGIVTCPVGDLPSGQVAVRSFVALAGSGLTGIVNNTATVSATTSDPNSANNSASTSSSTTAQADLSLTKTTSAGPIAGREITYTLNATNSGPSNATGAVITDTLPAGITFTAGTFPGGTCTNIGQVVTCAIGLLTPGATVTTTITAAVGAGVSGPSTNTATVTSPVPDPTPANRDASSTTTIGTLADVGVVLTPVPSPETVNAGETADYNIRVTNDGPSVARGVVVTGHLPPGLTPVLGSSQGACTVSGNTITCNLGDLNPGASAEHPARGHGSPVDSGGRHPRNRHRWVGDAGQQPGQQHQYGQHHCGGHGTDFHHQGGRSQPADRRRHRHLRHHGNQRRPVGRAAGRSHRHARRQAHRGYGEPQCGHLCGGWADRHL